jgi:16S rRNA (cytosine967-C5)-methyltransferase
MAKRSENKPSQAETAPVAGLPARQIAADILEGVLRRSRAFDEELEQNSAALATLEERDRALVRMLAATVLRRLGTLKGIIGAMIERPLPPEIARVDTALLLGAAQILFLDVPDHAAVDLSVRLVQAEKHAARYAGLVNAVLRRIAREGKRDLANLDTIPLDTPHWLIARWAQHYGADKARAIATANLHEPALDLTVKSDPQTWAERLGGRVMPNGTVRLIAHGPITALPGFAEGAWWVQDAAASLPMRLLGDIAGKSVADLCAAPGGKTAQLANAGARVTAVDRSAPRLKRLAENLSRLGLEAETVTADATAWKAGPFDAILLDAPCTATGTIRRHPDIPWLKGENDLAKLTALQRRLLDHAVTLLKPGGTLVYCTCSLEAEEGEEQIAALLARDPGLRRHPVRAPEVADSAFVTEGGDLRTLPCHWDDADSRFAGLDGFYAARLVRQ